MRQYILLLTVVLMGLAGYAQDDAQKELITRVETLEKKVAQQDAQLTQLATDLNTVLSQNLELKRNLNLKKPVAKAKVGDIEFRIIDVTGDSDTRDVHITMIVENNGASNQTAKFYTYNIIDELGSGYKENGRFNIKVEGISNDLRDNSLVYYVNTPLTINMTIKKYKENANYIKMLVFKIYNDGNGFHDIEFTDLPITWVTEE